MPGGVLGDARVSTCTKAEVNPLPQFPLYDEPLMLPLLPLHLGPVFSKVDGDFASQAIVISDCGVPRGSGLQRTLESASSTFKPLHKS